MKTNFYGFLIALLLSATLAFAYPAEAPFTASHSTPSLTALKASVAGLQCTSTDKRTQLTWSVKNNEMTGQLELERSINGKAFKTAAIIFPVESEGTAEYAFRDSNVSTKASYRIKVIQKNGTISYSSVIAR